MLQYLCVKSLKFTQGADSTLVIKIQRRDELTLLFVHYIDELQGKHEPNLRQPRRKIEVQVLLLMAEAANFAGVNPIGSADLQN